MLRYTEYLSLFPGKARLFNKVSTIYIHSYTHCLCIYIYVCIGHWVNIYIYIYIYILAETYHPTIVSTNKSVIKEWKLYSNVNSAKHFFCNSPVCAYSQPPNLKHMLVKSNLSRIPTLVGNSKCMKPRCQLCDILDTRKKLQIPGTSSTIQPGSYNCDSCDIIYFLMYSKCDSDNYIGETSNRLRFRLNNHKRSIRDNSRGFPGGCSFQPTRPFA